MREAANESQTRLVTLIDKGRWNVVEFFGKVIVVRAGVRGGERGCAGARGTRKRACAGGGSPAPDIPSLLMWKRDWERAHCAADLKNACDWHTNQGFVLIEAYLTYCSNKLVLKASYPYLNTSCT